MVCFSNNCGLCNNCCKTNDIKNEYKILNIDEEKCKYWKYINNIKTYKNKYNIYGNLFYLNKEKNKTCDSFLCKCMINSEHIQLKKKYKNIILYKNKCTNINQCIYCLENHSTKSSL